MRSRTQKSAEPKTPRESLNSSSIQKYLKKTSVKSPGTDTKLAGIKDKKKDQTKQKGERPREDLVCEGGSGSSKMEGQRNMDVLPTKVEMMEMFANLETAIKSEISNVRMDLGHLLRRVEEVEETTGNHAKEIPELKSQLSKLKSDYRMMAYKLEEQENQSRRQNLRIRSLPEQQNEDLPSKMKKIFNPILGLEEETTLKIDRVHRIRKPPNLRSDTPRDVIVKFHSFEDKDKIWKNLRGTPSVRFEDKDIQIFSDLSAGTLARRRQLRSLLEQLRRANIKYSWGFPTSLLVTREGRSLRLRFPEEIEDFCEKLGIPAPDILLD